MTASAMTRTLAALMFSVAAVAAGNAQAQNYDSAGLLRFGAFGTWSIIRDSQSHDIRSLNPDPAVAASAALANGSRSNDGFGFGLSFGYDFLFAPGWIVGLEGDGAVDSWQDDRHAREFGVDFLATVRGRLGAYVRPDVLLYATAGVAFLGVEYKRTEDFIFGNVSTEVPFDTNRTLIGGIVGGGVEYDWHDLTLFAEYLYASYNAFSADDPVVTNINLGLVATREHIKADVDEHLLRLGVKLKIGYDFLD